MSREVREPTGTDAGQPVTLGAGLRRWFLRPPRPHGEVIEDRRVSFLELFYDLVYVVLIARSRTRWPRTSRGPACSTSPSSSG